MQSDGAHAADDPASAVERTTDDGPADALLLQAMQSGDQSAVAVLYDRYGGAAYGLAYRICGDAPSAEDVVQDAFVALWKQAHRFDPKRGQVRSWLLTIVHHRAIDAVRRRSGRAERALPDGPDAPASAHGRPEEVAEATIAAEAVRRAVSGLPEDQRRAVEMAYFEGLTYAEIAERVGAPLGTVKSRLRLGIEKLRAGLRGVVFE